MSARLSVRSSEVRRSVLESHSVDMLPWILASASPRRRHLLTLFAHPFQVRTAAVDERRLPDEPPADYVLRLAEAKVRAVAAGLTESALVIGADTAVVDGEHVLGKPADVTEAWAMLHRLRGRTHRVLTGLSVLRTADGALVRELACTHVPMRWYSEAEMAAYIASGDPFDKAGGYAIQHPDFRPVSHLKGCYANVVGLPLCHLARALRRLGQPFPADLPVTCQRQLAFTCRVFSETLHADEVPCR